MKPPPQPPPEANQPQPEVVAPPEVNQPQPEPVVPPEVNHPQPEPVVPPEVIQPQPEQVVQPEAEESDWRSVPICNLPPPRVTGEIPEEQQESAGGSGVSHAGRLALNERTEPSSSSSSEKKRGSPIDDGDKMKLLGKGVVVSQSPSILLPEGLISILRNLPSSDFNPPADSASASASSNLLPVKKRKIDSIIPPVPKFTAAPAPTSSFLSIPPANFPPDSVWDSDSDPDFIPTPPLGFYLASSGEVLPIPPVPKFTDVAATTSSIPSIPPANSLPAEVNQPQPDPVVPPVVIHNLPPPRVTSNLPEEQPVSAGASGVVVSQCPSILSPEGLRSYLRNQPGFFPSAPSSVFQIPPPPDFPADSVSSEFFPFKKRKINQPQPGPVVPPDAKKSDWNPVTIFSRPPPPRVTDVNPRAGFKDSVRPQHLTGKLPSAEALASMEKLKSSEKRRGILLPESLPPIRPDAFTTLGNTLNVPPFFPILRPGFYRTSSGYIFAIPAPATTSSFRPRPPELSPSAPAGPRSSFLQNRRGPFSALNSASSILPSPPSFSDFSPATASRISPRSPGIPPTTASSFLPPPEFSTAAAGSYMPNPSDISSAASSSVPPQPDISSAASSSVPPPSDISSATSSSAPPPPNSSSTASSSVPPPPDISSAASSSVPPRPPGGNPPAEASDSDLFEGLEDLPDWNPSD